MGVNTILTHSGRGDQSVEVRSVNPGSDARIDHFV